jgi:hypothetical protein
MEMPKKVKRKKPLMTELQIARLENMGLKRAFHDRMMLDRDILNCLRVIAAHISSINDTLPSLLHARAWKEIMRSVAKELGADK